ncbi:hypothetical protein Q0F99_10345 [Rathayibacter oskolensis]|nr:hypothetical protein [Rathayibacter oskolensis]WKK70299.1 hypothetical protein Q0F99_10345 [Rathayibacter oskolensis]
MAVVDPVLQAASIIEKAAAPVVASTPVMNLRRLRPRGESAL